MIYLIPHLIGYWLLNYKISTIIDFNLLFLNINGEKIKCYFKSQEIIFQVISMFYEDYYIRLNFDIEYINSRSIIEIIVNIIYYLIQSNDLEISCFLINVILVLKKFQNDLNLYRSKNKGKHDEKKDKNNNIFYQNHINNNKEDINNINNKDSFYNINDIPISKTFLNDDIEENEDISDFENIDETNIFS